MRKKLLLINPVQEAKLSLATNIVIRVPPISLGYLAALTPPGWNIKIIDENVEPMTFEDADLVGITAMTSNAPRAYEISRQYRQKGIKTVIGGVHASMLPNEAIRFVDSVVLGEAESVWQKLLHDFDRNELKKFYRGERISLENLVRVRRDLYNSKKYKVKATVETARGCPMDCEFCSVTTLYGRMYRHRPVKEVLDELEAVDGKNVLFMDDNILGYGEKAEQRAIQLFRGMIERGLNKRWACQAGIDFANNSEVLKCAKRAGCLAVFIGLESLNEEVLKDIHKVRNLRVGVRNYKELVKKTHEHGIGMCGGFVFGSDRDEKDVFQRTTEFIMDSKLDGLQLSILTPLPGTRLYARLRQEGRLLHTNYPNDWKHYGFTQAVFKPKHMTCGELEDGVTQIYKDTTSRVTSIKRALNSTLFARSLYGGVVAYAYNRGYGSFWMKNYDNIRNGLPSRPKDPFRPYGIIDEGIYKTKDIDRGEDSSTKEALGPEAIKMTVEMCSTGINIIGDTPLGTHISQFYQTKDDLIDMLVPYFKAGLENNEFCMWITSEPLAVDDARKSLGQEVGYLDNYIDKGQIEILDASEWYTKGGKFEPDMVSQNWVEKERQVSGFGFNGMRVSGNTSWLQRDQRRAFADYEADLEKKIGNCRMIALCSYPLDKCVPSDVLDVLKNHNFNIYRYEGKWEIIETGQFRRK